MEASGPVDDQNVPFLLEHPSIPRPCPRPVPALSAPCPRPVRTLPPPCLRPVRALSAPCPHPVRALSAPCPRPVRALYAPCPRPVPALSPPCPRDPALSLHSKLLTHSEATQAQCPRPTSGKSIEATSLAPSLQRLGLPLQAAFATVALHSRSLSGNRLEEDAEQQLRQAASHVTFTF